MNSAGTGSPRNPQLHWAVINGVGVAINFSGGVGRVLVRSDLPQIDAAPRFDIAMEDVTLGASNSAAMRKWLMHGCHSHDKAQRIHT